MEGANIDSLSLFYGLALKKTLTFIGEGATDTIDGNGFSVAKTVFIDNVENTTFQPTSPVVFGALDVDQDEAASAVTFVLSNIVAVKGKLTYCGSPIQDDNVTLCGQVGGAAKLMLDDGINKVLLASRMASTLNITGGGGADSITFTDVQTALIDPAIVPNNIGINAKAVKISVGGGENVLTLQKGAHFYNSLTFKTGAENDTVSFGDFYVQKSLKLSVGDGQNLLKHFEGTHGIGSSLKYVGTSGNDTLSIDNIVTGKMSLKLGDGANGVTGTAQILGSSVSIIGGAGVDTLSVGFNSNTARLTAKLAGSDDSFTYLSGALASAIIDGGSNTTLSPGDTFTNEAGLPVNHTLIGFETP